MSSTELASKLILQSPPGQINDCYQDLHGILQDEQTLTEGLKPALQQYNIQQYLVAELPEAKEPALLCHHAILSTEDRYVDPKSKQIFDFDHLQLTASNLEPLHVWDALEGTRASLQEAASTYAREHLSQGVATVFSASAPQQPVKKASPEPVEEQQAPESTDDSATRQESNPESGESETKDDLEGQDEQSRSSPDEKEEHPATSDGEPQSANSAQPEPQQDIIPEPTEHIFALYFVGNKYNPSNFWAGRWRSCFHFDADLGKLSGETFVHVHYYEQGNVQLHTSKKMEVSLSPNASAKDVLKSISTFEREYQLSLNEAYAELGDSTFKDLRRALPVTKQKLDWNRITSYKLKDDLQK